MTRRICVVTGSRADYGLLRWVMKGIKEDPQLQLQVLATAMHLSPEFDLTYREIERDGFRIDRKVETLMSSDTPAGIAKSMGLGLIGYADALHDLQPDLLVVLGDRYEILAAVAAALVARLPVAHLHGGEATEGAFDDAIRHSITKMSHLHFVAAEDYRRRVIQMGEHPDNVHLVGGLGIDSIRRLKLLDRAALEQALDFKLAAKNLLVTFHPPTLDGVKPHEQMTELLAALDSLRDTNVVFTLPNADTHSRGLMEMVRQFVATRPNTRAYASLGQLRYLSCVSHVDGVVGNSSSGLTEVPTFRKGTVNIGDRQRGRLQAESVINCEPTRQSIRAAIDKLYSRDFQRTLQHTRNPYGDGGASERIVAVLRDVRLIGLERKTFFDLPLVVDKVIH